MSSQVTLKIGHTEVNAGLGNALASLLARTPAMLRTTSAARVLQYLIEHEPHLKMRPEPVSALISSLGLDRHLVETIRDPEGLWEGILGSTLLSRQI